MDLEGSADLKHPNVWLEPAMRGIPTRPTCARGRRFSRGATQSPRTRPGLIYAPRRGQVDFTVPLCADYLRRASRAT
jgi:hypothetical protein